MSESKAGWVYVGESTRKNGQKQVYTGMTQRTPYKRWGEHIKNVKSSASQTYVGKGKFFKPLGAVWSSNARKAEKTIKKMTSTQKRSFGKYAAKKYYSRKKR
jgi:predicted GIY-YIG superfamily endonuclease